MAQIAYAVVQCNNQDSNPDPTIISGSGIVTVSSESTKGVFHVQFDDGFFSNVPSVTVTQVYNGANNSTLNPISCGNYAGGNALDNAVVICLEQNFCRIKTGKSDGSGRYRSFCIQAIGS